MRICFRYHSVLSPTKRVITVAPMPPEKSAYALARYSRSPDSIRDSIDWVRSHDSQKFLESFYFQYGHASIADLGHTVMCFEGISELAATEIEEEPLWDGQAKSSRYQDFSRSGFVTPPEFSAGDAEVYGRAGEALCRRRARARLEGGQHGAERLSAMAEGELLGGGGFAESEAERGRVEERIVSEAGGAPRLVEDDARHRAAKDATKALALDQRDYAHEARGPVGHASQLFEQQAVVGFVGGVRAGEAGGMNAGGAAEGVHFQARIVGEELDANRRLRGREAELAELAGVAGGAVQANQMRATFF